MNKYRGKKIEEEVFVCLDCETTGLDVEKDRIIEIAVVLFKGKEILEQWDSLINPECEIPESSIKIHHIKPEMVEGKPTIKEVLPHVLKMVGQHVIVGHGIQFDIKMITAAALREGIPCEIEKNSTIDTVRMGRLYGESPSNSLEKLREHFNIEDEGAHRALSDVMVNIDVFRYLSRFYHSKREIVQALREPILLKFMPLGPHKGRLMSEVPLEFLKWAAYKNFDEDLLFTIRSELKKRKQGNQFGQSTNPFQNL